MATKSPRQRKDRKDKRALNTRATKFIEETMNKANSSSLPKQVASGMA